MAAFLSSGATLCLHEPITWFSMNFLAMAEYVKNLPHQNVGISDSGILVKRVLFSALYRECPVLVIERNKSIALDSHRRHYGVFLDGRAEKAFDETERGLQALEAFFSTVKRISFDSLGTAAGARVAWDFCCPNQPFDEARYQAMDRIVCNPKT
jgi:hypothetical protein